MDEGGGKEDPSLPRGYVSLAMLQERWMRKQERTPEKNNLRGEKEEEDKRGTASGFPNESLGHGVLKYEGDQKMAGGLLRDPPWRRVENGGREMGLIEVKEKGKEIAIGGTESGGANKAEKKKKKKKKKNRNKTWKNFGKKKSEENGERKDGERNEKTNGDKFHEVGIVPRDDVKVGIERVLSGKTNGCDRICGELKGVQGSEIAPLGTVVLPRSSEGERQQIPDAKGRGHGGGFRRNSGLSGNKGGRGTLRIKADNRGFLRHMSGNELKETGVNSALEKKMEGETGGSDEDQKEGGRINIECDGFHRGVEDEVFDALKVNEVKLDSENKIEDEISEVTNGVRGMNGREYGNGFRRYGNGNWRGSTGRKFRNPAISDCEVGYARSWVERDGGYNRRYADSRRFGKVWVKKGEKMGDAAAANGSSGISVDQH